MLQRIQSLYLLLTALLLCLGFCLPTAYLTNGGDSFLLNYKGIYRLSSDMESFLSPVWGITTFAVTGIVLALLTTFLFKNRKLQMKFIYVSIVNIIFCYASIYAYLCAAIERHQASWSLGYAIVMPGISLILCLLALSAIKKDEALVKSHERLR